MDVREANLILLAGGNSSRMGTPKGLLEYQGRAWLEMQLMRARDRGLEHAIVVLGYHEQAYRERIAWLSPALSATQNAGGISVRAIVNRQPELGPFSSVQAGASLVESGKSVLVLPVDVPCPAIEVWQALAAAMQPGVEVCVPEWHGRGGHPVLLSSQFLGQLLLLDPALPSSRLDGLIHALPREKVARVSVDDPSIRMNINDLATWERFAKSGVA